MHAVVCVSDSQRTVALFRQKQEPFLHASAAGGRAQPLRGTRFFDASEAAENLQVAAADAAHVGVTMMFEHPPLLDTDACLEFVNSLAYGKAHPVKELADCATATCVWGCLNEIYPDWFDDTLHPSKFNSPEEALGQILYYVDEFNEGKYAADIKAISDHVSLFLQNDPTLVLKTYELLLLSTVHGDCQQIIAKILDMSQSTQANIQAVLQQYAGAEEEDGIARTLSRSLSEAAGAAQQRLLSSASSRDDSFLQPQEEESGRRAAGGGAANKELQEELQAARTEARRLKTALTESETQREALADRVKQLEKEKNEEQSRRIVLEKQLEARRDVMLKEFSEQLEESDKQLAKVKNELEKERREKKKVEEKAKVQLDELKDEMEVLKQEARRVSVLEVHIQNYKKKLSEVSSLKEKISQLELQNKAYMDKLVEADAGSLGAAGLRKQLDSYKNRIADAEARVSAVTAEKEAAQQLKEEAEKQLGDAQKKLALKDLEVAQLQATIEAKEFDLSDLRQTLKKREAAGDENATVAETPAAGAAAPGDDARVAELSNALDDLKRVKERLEKTCAVHVAQIAVLQQEVAQAAGSSVDSEKVTTYLQKLAAQEEELKQLRESKDQMAKEMMEALKKGATGAGGAADEATLAKVTLLETQLQAEKKQAALREDIVRAQVQKEMESLLSTLKQQLQIREREASFYKKAIEENVESNKKEVKLLSSVLYEIGLRYHQLRAFCDQVKNENEAIKLRVKARAPLDLDTADVPSARSPPANRPEAFSP